MSDIKTLGRISATLSDLVLEQDYQTYCLVYIVFDVKYGFH